MSLRCLVIVGFFSKHFQSIKESHIKQVGPRPCRSLVCFRRTAHDKFIDVFSPGEGRVLTHQAGAYPGFCSMKRLGIFLLPLDGMLVHPKVSPSIKLAGTHLYTWMGRGTVRVTCLALEHYTMPLLRART